MTYRITHRTTYRYESVVSASYGEMHLLPRDLPHQRCVSSEVRIEPRPDDYRERRDFFGNRAGFFSVLTPHADLTVTTTSMVEVQPRPSPLAMSTTEPWDRVGERLRTGRGAEVADAAQFVLSSPLVEIDGEVAEYARPSFAPGRPILAAVEDLSRRIHGEFAYTPGATSVNTTLAEVLTARRGVCQDFAHLAIGCLRSVGLAARYVSGYLENVPPDGRSRLVGADMSHAWLSVFVPEVGWVDIDPTNDQFVDTRHVTIGWGRDYGDVPPLKGVIFTEGRTNTLEVSVDVAPV